MKVSCKSGDKESVITLVNYKKGIYNLKTGTNNENDIILSKINSELLLSSPNNVHPVVPLIPCREFTPSCPSDSLHRIYT